MFDHKVDHPRCSNCGNGMIRPRMKFKTHGIIQENMKTIYGEFPIQTLGEVDVGDEPAFTYSDGNNKFMIYDYMCGLCGKIDLYGEIKHD